ncbi:MAG: pilus assembly PilX family protein, partial [Solimonas sp.]
MTRPPVQKQNGYALVTAMIFLIILTLVALIAIRSTGLEIKMGANSAMRIEALEASETPRTALGPLLDAHVFARGWPESAGGDVVDSLFAYTIPTQMTIAEDSGVPRTWYAANTEVDEDPAYVFDPLHLDPDVTYARDAAASGTPAYQITGTLSVFKLRT